MNCLTLPNDKRIVVLVDVPQPVLRAIVKVACGFLRCHFFFSRFLGNSVAGTPEDIAKVVAFLASDESAWLTGEVILASGGLR